MADTSKRRVTNVELLYELEHMKSDLADTCKRVKDLHGIVVGNASPEKGLVTRVVLLESFSGALKRLVWLAVGAGVTSAVGFVVMVARLILQQ